MKYINPGFKLQILEHLLWRTVPLAVPDPCSILVDNTSYILVDIDCTVLFRRISSSSRTVISILQN